MGHTTNADGSLTATRTPTQTVADFQAGYDRIEEIGGLLKGTRDERLALTSGESQPGWIFAETDTGKVYVRLVSGGWATLAPYAQAAGRSAVAASGTTPISFPSGRFSVPPILNLTPGDHPNVIVPRLVPGTLTKDGFSAQLFTLGAGQVAADVHWTATQSTSAAAAG